MRDYFYKMFQGFFDNQDEAYLFSIYFNINLLGCKVGNDAVLERLFNVFKNVNI